jgi:ribosomal protein L12E/L44/L45/RPP1/RPP2
MATRQVTLSDIGGDELTDENHARVIVEHPDVAFPVELDMSIDEAEKLNSTTLQLVTITVHAPDVPPRRVTMEARVFGKVFDGVDVEKVLEGARRASAVQTPSAPARGRPAKAAGTAAPKGDKINYTDMQNIGLLHRGRTTEEEARLVRENMDQANKNRIREGQPLIDPANEKDKKRYGF